ncbi:MAG: D-alanyl-D-alanine carboxypeptidase [Lachnospiraceae bacterium]|nr:D-alanyl-D-alanine carboxypeptidase [Lachnospiraceae bacterium]
MPRAVEEYGTVQVKGLSAGVLAQAPWLLSSGEEAIFPLAPEIDSFYRGYHFNETDATVAFGNSVVSNFAILVDVDSGEIIAQRNPYEKLYPASMTKVMTVLVAAKHILKPHLDDMYTFTETDLHAAYNNDCSAVGYQEGEQATVRDLFYGTILPSGADCASGLACYVAGDNASFAAMMNDEAKRLGLSEGTHFTNSVGYYDEENYTTAHDMAVIMKAALENDLCREVIGTRSYHGTPTPSYPGGVNVGNWFLRHIDKQHMSAGEAAGAKTGYVHESGMCCVSYLVSNSGGHYILVTAKGANKNATLREHVMIYNAYIK